VVDMTVHGRTVAALGRSAGDIVHTEASNEALRLLKQPRNVILYGPPGTGKTFAAQQVRSQWLQDNGDGSVFFVTFHPSYSYEEFVEGFRPTKDKPGEFTLQSGILLLAAGEATRRRTLLVIDEISRADVSRVLGELITFIEPDKRGFPFRTAQRPGVDQEIPADLYLLGTMNTADKSISLLDVALRRRFAFLECPPDPGAYRRIPDWLDSVLGVPLADILASINQRLTDRGVERERLVGHALLAIPANSPDPVRALEDRLRYDIVPLISEYLFEDLAGIGQVLRGIVDDNARYAGALTADSLMTLASDATSATALATAAIPVTPGVLAAAPEPAGSDGADSE